MKRMIRAAESKEVVTVDSVEDFLSDRGEYSKYGKFTPHEDLINLKFTDQAIDELYDNMMDSRNPSEYLDLFLYRVNRIATPSSAKQLKQQLNDSFDIYMYVLDTKLASKAKNIFETIAKNLKGLGIKGLRFKAGREYLTVSYAIDRDIYNTSSASYANNFEELKKCIESIPAVRCIRDHDTENSDVILAWWNKDSDNCSISYLPNIDSVAKREDSEISYQVTYVCPPIYMSRLPFHYAKKGNVMYMTPTEKFKASSDSVQDFIQHVYSEPDETINSWSEYFDFLDDQEYDYGSALIRGDYVVKIQKTENGRRKTIYSKPLP